MESYKKLYGESALNGATDGGSAAAPAVQVGFSSAALDAPGAVSVFGGGSTAPVLPNFKEALGMDRGASTINSATMTTGSTSESTTTQTVSFAGSSIVFNNTYTGAVSSAYKSCILSAEQQIASTWHNACTINVEFDAQSPGQTGWLAENSFYVVNVSYASLKSALTSLSSAEPGDTYLQQAVAHLPSTDPSNGAGFALPLPYARMLGLSSQTQNPEDTVTLNTSYNWSYGQDVVNTIEHEISEGGMGRIGGLGDQNGFWSTMDLFRYNSSGQPDYTDGRDGQTTYFSYNGGATLSTLSFNNEYSGSTKVNSGDTADFTQLDVFGTGSPGETNTLSQTDLQVMDALGWSPTVPTTAEMIMTDASGNYYIYDLGGNSIQGSNLLQNLGTGFTFGGIGSFGGDRGDMMLRASNGDLDVYDISNNQITSTHDLGNVGLDWTIAGFGNFNGNAGETDLIMRQSSGALEVYDISNNQVTFAASLGNFGSNTVAGFGDFSGHAGETDMMMRSTAGDLIVYDMGKNSVTSGPIDLGNVGLDWAVYGFGDFSSNANETDLIMRNSNTGNFELYDISNNRVVSAVALGNVGPEWTLAGFGDFSGNPGETDMMLRDSNTGAFEVYDFANNRIYSAMSGGQVTLGQVVAGVGPNVQGSDTTLSTSASAVVESTLANTIGQSAATDAGGDNAQVTLVNEDYEIAPPLDNFFGQSWLTPGWVNDAAAMNAVTGQAQPAAGSISGLSDIVPNISSFFSAPAAIADSSQTTAEPSAASPIFGAGVLQHTV